MRALPGFVARAAVCFFAAGLIAAVPLGPSDAVAITEAVQHELNVSDLDAGIFQEPPYAVAFWKAENGHAGGQALVKNAGNGAWTIVKMTTGAFDAAALQALGVPAKTSKALIADLANAK